MLRILVADDSESDRILITALIKQIGHSCLCVDSGLSLLSEYDEYQPDMVLLDVLMPGIDGLETARRIKAKTGEYFIPIIFLTGLDEKDFIEQCLEAGGDDFLSKPVNLQVLKAKLTALERLQSMQNSLIAHRNQISQTHQQLINEQSVAKYVFDAITGKGQLDCGTIRYHLSSHAIFNGDVLLASIRPNGNLIVLLGDFTGHGLPAALGAIPLSSSFYTMVATGFSQVDILRELNEKMHVMLPRGLFCCAMCVELDYSRRQLSVWNGGQPTGYFYRAGEHKAIPLPSTSLPLGVDVNDNFSDSCTKLDFGLDDRLIFWSDGIYDTRNSLGERFGQSQILQITENLSDGKQADLFDTLLQLVKSHIGEDKSSDDVSLVEVVTRPPNASLEVVAQTKTLKGPVDWRLEFEVRPPTFQSFDPVPALMTLLTQVPGLGAKATSLFTVLSELYSNALDHGLLGLSSLSKSCDSSFGAYYQEREKRLKNLQTGFIRFQINLTTIKSMGRLVVKIEDSGAGFDYQTNSKTSSSHLLHGRGIDLVRQFCQSLEYEGKGNIVRAVYVWPLDK